MTRFADKICGCRETSVCRTGIFQFAAPEQRRENQRMARRTLLREAWWRQATATPGDVRPIARRYTLDRGDLDLIMRQNKASNRLRIACVLATLHYPGWPLGMARSCQQVSSGKPDRCQSSRD
ncbi:MAG: DUF4158 domain-containing protein [Rhizobiaceae bacterium]|nr:DUF4158 domain-containing protein [Rhizobiaceae bacterium]